MVGLYAGAEAPTPKNREVFPQPARASRGAVVTCSGGKGEHVRPAPPLAEAFREVPSAGLDGVASACDGTGPSGEQRHH